MLLNHVKLSLRALVRDSTYSIINIGGLSVGIAACVLLAMWVKDELSYDRFHGKHEKIFKLNANFDNNGNSITWTTTNGPIATFGKKEIAAVDDATRISGDNGIMLFRYGDKEFTEAYNTAYVDEAFFKIFDFKLIKGNQNKPFPDNKSIIIDESTALKYFGNDNPIGKSLTLDNRDEYIVQGIIEDMPANSSIRYSVLFPFQILIDTYRSGDFWKSLETDWGNYNYDTYFLLQPGASHVEVAQGLTAIHHANQEDSGVRYSLQPIDKLHLYNADGTEGAIQVVRIFGIVAVAIILIACINYINLATARASKRAKEVGVRKTVGADRKKLISQFLIESGIVTILATTVAIGIIQLAIPFYNTLSGKALYFNMTDTAIITLVAAVLFITWIIAGIYPALVLSSFQPMQVIRGKLILSGGNSTFRKILVVTQFSLSIIIIIGTLVVGQQLNYIQKKDLGYEKENIFGFGLRGDMMSKKDAILKEISEQPGVVGVSLANQNILEISNSTGDTDWEGKPEDQVMMIHPMSIDEHFTQLLGLEIIEGRNFNGSPADTLSIILNETAVREAGISDPVGKTFQLWNFKTTIIGVVKDFHHHSVHNPIEPTVFFSRPDWQWLLYVKTDGIHTQEAINACETVWKRFNPSYPFDYNFLDSFFDTQYKAERRMEQVFTAFALIALVISCLGLFGLTTFTIAQRVKEIGIRKIMGASVSQIVIILSKDFLTLVLIAIMISVPLAYYFMNQWLDNFAYRIPLSWPIFAIAGATAMVIAILTMSVQTLRAGFMNPVKSLRTE